MLQPSLSTCSHPFSASFNIQLEACISLQRTLAHVQPDPKEEHKTTAIKNCSCAATASCQQPRPHTALCHQLPSPQHSTHTSRHQTHAAATSKQLAVAGGLHMHLVPTAAVLLLCLRCCPASTPRSSTSHSSAKQPAAGTTTRCSHNTKRVHSRRVQKPATVQKLQQGPGPAPW